MSINNIDEFRRCFEETIAWCSSQNWSYQSRSWEKLYKTPIVSGKGLRTDQLRPLELSDAGTMVWGMVSKRPRIVKKLAMKRAALLQEQDIPLVQLVQPLSEIGRLLAFDPDGSTNDGALYDFTQGFIDGYNLPSWDTWIGYVTNDPVSNFDWWQGCDSYLLSWVPDSLVAGVDNGISMNSDQCVRWARDLDSAFILQLQQAGLLC